MRTKIWSSVEARTLYHNKKHYQFLKGEVLSAYGNVCVCCGEKQFELLTIDHIGGYRSLETPRSGRVLYQWLIANKFPKDFQCLCMSCNWGKGRYGTCPHKPNKLEPSDPRCWAIMA